jgi:hypothetical protein
VCVYNIKELYIYIYIQVRVYPRLLAWPGEPPSTVPFPTQLQEKQKSGWGQLPQLPLKITQHFEEATCTPSVA